MSNAPIPVPSPAASFARNFFERLTAALSEVDVPAVEAIVDVLVAAHRSARCVHIMGNGGSAATASHFACDLHATVRGQPGLRVASLSDNVPLLTALANDHGYENVFVEQLSRDLQTDDVVVVLSASGSSENVLRALRLARQRKATTVGLLGFGGGQAEALTDHAIVVSSEDFGIVESVHNALEHLLSASFRRRVLG